MKKILVIEDNDDVRENLCEILELADYEVYQANNGKVGVEQAKEHQPDLIICDVMMPQLDGFGVLKILNNSIKLNHIPVIFLTARAEKEDIRKGMGLGADDYITKPFDDTELLEAIEIRLKKSERLKKSVEAKDGSIQSFFSEAKANEEFKKLSDNQEVREYSKKEIVYSEGQNCRWLFHILKGQVKEYQINEYGKELTTQLYKEGDFFGYFPLLNDNRYPNNAAVTEDSKLQLIPKNDFQLLIYNNRDFMSQFIKLIANRAENIEKQLIEMAYSSVRKKVANSLLAYSKLENEKYIVNVTREDLAAKAGTAKETLIRTLSDFKSEGLIEADGKKIVLSQPIKIKELIA